MRLFDNLRNAEQKGVRTMRRGMERVREELGDIERRIRQRMRIYPQKPTNVTASVADHEPDGDIIDQGLPAGIGELPETKRQTPIVSVHGRDIKAEDLEKGNAA
ncbi:MAG TPA: hypothetical protein VHA33_01800 [Candidatus Angelobacter sp.]|jgi:hypothetical protein|nr:hypothetical protein [Candidatus Angelobacter sp.]